MVIVGHKANVFASRHYDNDSKYCSELSLNEVHYANFI